MYTTCLFCTRPLGTNEVLDQFPIGRRVAFDGEKGRLWVVCPHCERWNLTPLEERWEAIEQAERLYRDTRLRVSTDQIGLARLPEGLELVRIGRPARPEIAAWRYGDQFGRRRRSRLISAGVMVGGGALVVAGGAAAGVGVIGLWNMGRLAYGLAMRGWPLSTVARLRDDTGRLIHAGGSEQFLGKIAKSGDRLTTIAKRTRDWMGESGDDPLHFGLLALPTSVSLAMEMALHEEQERRALEGELRELERAWRDAEEIGAISDTLLLPPWIDQALERLRGRGAAER